MTSNVINDFVSANVWKHESDRFTHKLTFRKPNIVFALVITSDGTNSEQEYKWNISEIILICCTLVLWLFVKWEHKMNFMLLVPSFVATPQPWKQMLEIRTGLWSDYQLWWSHVSHRSTVSGIIRYIVSFCLFCSKMQICYIDSCIIDRVPSGSRRYAWLKSNYSMHTDIRCCQHEENICIFASKIIGFGIFHGLKTRCTHRSFLTFAESWPVIFPSKTLAFRVAF